MKLVSDNVEFRRSNKVEGKNGVYYLHSFEDEKGAFQLYSKEPLALNKGDEVRLEFQTGLFDGKIQYNFVGVFNGK